MYAEEPNLTYNLHVEPDEELFLSPYRLSGFCRAKAGTRACRANWECCTAVAKHMARFGRSFGKGQAQKCQDISKSSSFSDE